MLVAGTLVGNISAAQVAGVMQQPDMQVAVFMVPLTLLVLALIFEVARICLRGTPPVQAPPPARPTDWALSGDGA